MVTFPFEYTHKKFHIMQGHPGIKATVNTLKVMTNLNPQRIKIIEDEIKTCMFCQTAKVNKNKYGQVSGHVVTEKPFEHIASDIFGPFSLENFEHDFERPSEL